LIKKDGGVKIAVVGAGFVGTAFAYSLLIRSLASEVVLIDADRDRAEGEAMDLSHGLPFLEPAAVRAGDYVDSADSDIVVVAAGGVRKSMQSRVDWARENFAVMSRVVSKVTEYNKKCILLIATSPLML